MPQPSRLLPIVALAMTVSPCAAVEYVGQIVADEGTTFCLATTNGGLRIDVRDVPHASYGCGDIVRVRGEPDLPVTSIARIGRRPLPEPIETTAARISGGENDFGIVRLTGVISAVTKDELDSNWIWFVLRTATGAVNVSVRTNHCSLARLHSLLDADVSLTGVAAPFSSWRRPLGSHLLLVGPDSISVIHPPPGDLRSPSKLNPASVGHPHRLAVTGILLAATRTRLFVKAPDGMLVIVKKTDDTSASPPPGVRMTVVGFTEMNPFNVQMTDAVVRNEPASTFPLSEPEDIDATCLFATPRDAQAINTDYHGRIIRISGTVTRQSEDDSASGTLTLNWRGRTVSVDLTGLSDYPSRISRPGTVLSVAGVCLAEFEQTASAALFPRFKGFVLVPRSAEDIRIMANPPWWTTFRLICAIAGLLVVLVAILIWNRAINVLANRRGHELYREQMKHARAELKVEERTRLAVELHDSISQTLTGVSLQVDAAIRNGGDGLGPTRSILETARQMLASCRHELRCCLWDLRSRTFEEKDLTEAVKKTVAPHAREADITVRFNVPRDRLSEPMTHTVLRIVRELTVNAIRHGHATQVKIAGEYSDGFIRFSVRDDGCGFDPESFPGPEQGHYGLLGIRERLAQHAGTIDIRSAAGRGSKITITLKNDTIGGNET